MLRRQRMQIQRLFLRPIQIAILCSAGLCGLSVAQGNDPTVEWAASWAGNGVVAHGGVATLELAAQVQPGWHVYALLQPPGGPIPLRVTLDDDRVGRLADAPSGTAPEETHDPRFNLDTRFYTHAFTVHVPVQVSQQAGAGRQVIPVSVRFQTCSDRECQPPKTIHLSVPIDVLPEGGV
jgi:DsbC/DsbD-like thiol-disulfide interchange protein